MRASKDPLRRLFTAHPAGPVLKAPDIHIAEVPHGGLVLIEEAVVDAHGPHPGGLCAPAGGQAVVEHGARLRRRAVLGRRGPPQLRGLLLQPQVMGEGDALKVSHQVQPGQGGPAVLRHAGGHNRHPLALRPALFQIGPDAGLHGHVGVGVLRHRHPLGDDVLAGLLQAAELLREFRRQGQDSVGHPLVVRMGVGKAPPGQKFPVHVLPDAVGVDQRPGPCQTAASADSPLRGKRGLPFSSRCGKIFTRSRRRPKGRPPGGGRIWKSIAQNRTGARAMKVNRIRQMYSPCWRP